MKNTKLQKRNRRKIRISSDIVGTAERPRVSIYRSNKYIYAQAIDDMAAKTVAACSSLKLDVKGTKSEKQKK
jgi:large subunit ribosomal protein L18